MIGHLQSEADAQVFSDYLYVQGIKNQVETEKDGAWAVWIHSEDELDNARKHFTTFRTQPGDPEFRRLAGQAKDLREKEREQDEAAAKRFIDAGQIFRQQGAYGMGAFTMILIALSVIVWALREFGGNRDFGNFLFISEFDFNSRLAPLSHGLPEVRRGEIWRIATPIFLHFHILHILFNMLWLKDLGSMVEARQGAFRLGLLVLVIAALSNVAQYYWSGPLFGGMSGVVYGLLGYIWMKAKYDLASGYYLHPTTVAFMLIWFVVCLTGLMSAANTVHAVGLGTGVAWGYLSAMRSRW